MKGIILFDYQKAMLVQVIDGFKREPVRTVAYRDVNRKRDRRTLGRTVMVQMPSGTGKNRAYGGMSIIHQEKFLLKANEAGFQGIGFTAGLNPPDFQKRNRPLSPLDR